MSREATGGPSESTETWLDRAFQVAYRGAYQVMKTYWSLRQPTTHGTLVALWNQGEVLLVRNSYVPYYSAPGGYIGRHETALQAAQRELLEEVGVEVAPEQLELSLDVTHRWAGKNDHVQIFSVELAERPVIDVDHREVVEASWWTREQALALNVFPPLKRVIDAHGQPAPASSRR